MLARTESTTLPDRDDAPARSAFIWRYGVIGWGVPSGLAFALVTDYMEAGDCSLAARLAWFAASMGVFAVAGVFYGRYMWWSLGRNKPNPP